jgi:hypothetical protein
MPYKLTISLLEPFFSKTYKPHDWDDYKVDVNNKEITVFLKGKVIDILKYEKLRSIDIEY